MKSCNKCGEAKPLDEFYNLKSSKDGKQNSCKKCQNEATYRRRVAKAEEHKKYQREYNAKYQKENADRLREYAREYRKENEENLKQKRAEWVEDNREHMREYYEAYYAENKDHLRESRKQYYREHLSEFRHRDRIRRERVRGSSVSLTKEQELDLFKRFDHRCALTGKKGDIHLDHFIPVAVGGNTSVENMIPLCAELNISKHANNPFEWVGRRKDVPQDSFDRVVLYLAQLNGLSVNEYREFVYLHFNQYKNKNIS